MKSYTLFSCVSVFVVLLLDVLCKTHLQKRKIFWIFHLMILVLTTVVDSFVSGLPVVIFSDSAILGIRFFSVPLENYLFGFSLLTLNLILFELFSAKNDILKK